MLVLFSSGTGTPSPHYRTRRTSPPQPLPAQRAPLARCPNYYAGALRVLGIIGGEHPLGSAEPPRLSHELGHLIEVDPVEPDQDRRVAVVMGRDEKRARLGLEQPVALLQASAAYEKSIGQLVNAEEQGAAHPE